MIPECQEIINNLYSKKASERKKAAKKFRLIKSSIAGKYLLTSLENELSNTKTWEIKYHIIMAIAHNQYSNALPFLYTLTNLDLEPMVMVGLGDSITRLEISSDKDRLLINDALLKDNIPLCEGCIRAFAFLKTNTLADSLVDLLISTAEKPQNKRLLFWTASASAGWDQASVKLFLNKIIKDISLPEDIRAAAILASKKKYRSWNIL